MNNYYSDEDVKEFENYSDYEDHEDHEGNEEDENNYEGNEEDEKQHATFLQTTHLQQGIGARIESLVSHGKNLKDKNTRKFSSEKDKFYIKLEQDFYFLKEKLEQYFSFKKDSNTVVLTDKDFDSLLDMLEEKPNIENYNPICLMLGFLASKGGRDKTLPNFKQIIKKCHNKFEGVKDSDILRYSRLWLSLNNNLD